jgi:phosphate transport system protein
MTVKEPRRDFHQSLDDIHQELIRVGASVTEFIARATRILLDLDLEGADLMISGDDEIDARCINLEERCYQVMALQAPVAGDLRALVAAIRMTSEIERSADLTVNICKAARRIYGHEIAPKLRGIIHKMSDQAQQLFAAAMEAYDERDNAKAAAIDDMDSFLDDLHKQFIQAIFETHAAGLIDLQVALQLAVVARFYERIGDHAVNIAEKVRYIVSGWVPEHVGAARYAARSDYTPPGGTARVATHDAIPPSGSGATDAPETGTESG